MRNIFGKINSAKPEKVDYITGENVHNKRRNHKKAKRFKQEKVNYYGVQYENG